MKRKLAGLISTLMVIAIILTGCSSATGSNTSTTTASTETTSSTSSTSSSSTTNSDSSAAATLLTSSEVVVDTEFTANDLEVGYDESTATDIVLDGSSIEVSGNGASVEGETVTISKEGTYVVSGTLDDGQIVIDAGDNAKIQLVLNGATINCSDNAPIYIKNADKVFITLVENTVNTLSDKNEYVQQDDNTVDAVIFSMSDLTINGNGTLNITANYKHGIVSKDELTFTGGTFNITAVGDAINGKDCVKIKDGSFTLSSSEGNGIKSKNDEDATAGYVFIYGGTVTVIKCQEGIEGTAIVIEGGTVDITASDDGFNAASGSTSSTSAASADTDSALTTAATTTATTTFASTALTNLTSSNSDTAAATLPLTATDSTTTDTTVTDSSETSDFARGGPGHGGFGGGDFGGGGAMENDTNCYISISGGSISINAAGDGIDSNGSIVISGGTIYVSGPTENMNGGLDYNGTADITGGTILVAGSIGMAQGFSDTSTQYSILYNLSSTVSAGTEISLTDSEGNLVASYTPDKEYQSVVISTPELKNGQTYTLTCGDQTADVTLTSIVTNGGEAGGFGGKMNGMTRPGN